MSRSCGCGFGQLTLGTSGLSLSQAGQIVKTTAGPGLYTVTGVASIPPPAPSGSGAVVGPSAPLDMAAIGKSLVGTRPLVGSTPVGTPSTAFRIATPTYKTARIASSARPSDVPGVIRQGGGGSGGGEASAGGRDAAFEAACVAVPTNGNVVVDVALGIYPKVDTPAGAAALAKGARTLCRFPDGSLLAASPLLPDGSWGCATDVVQAGACAGAQGGGNGGTGGAKTNTALMLGGAALLALALLRR